MQENTIKAMKLLFLTAALWNITGAVFGYFNTELTFQNFFGRELTDPLFYAIYQGAWGTTFVYFFGYLIVAHNPLRHPGIVIVGGIGKIGYAIKLLQLYLIGLAGPIVLIVIIGDFIFFLLFLWYFYQLYKSRIPII